MKAARIHSFGGSDKITIEEDVPPPKLGVGEVLVRIRDAGVNPIDWKIREGFLKEQMDTEFPMTLGQDFAGEVVEVGDQAPGFKPGDEVFGFAHGSYAELATVPANAMALKPKTVDFTTAASIPTAGLTAWQIIVDVANVRKDQKVLIHGAAGGVGSLAAQLAKWKGALVIATAAAEDAAYLREIGVDRVIDYKAEKFEERVNGVDLVVDLIGSAVLGRSYPVLKKQGSLLVSTVGQPDPNALDRIGAKGVRFVMKRDASELGQLAKLIDQGIVKPRLAEIFPLDEAKKAQDILQQGRSHGKIVLEVRP